MLQVALIQCAQAMGIQRYIFFSIHNCERHPEVPLMLIKSCTEEYLRKSGLNFTIFRLCGFMQVCLLGAQGSLSNGCCQSLLSLALCTWQALGI